MMTESAKNIPVDSWCVTKLKTVETEYQWTIENFSSCMKKPLDNLKSGIFSSVLGDKKTLNWQLKFNLKSKAGNTDYLSMSLCRLDNLKDVKPTVKVTYMIINCDRQVERTVDTIDEAAYDKELEILDFIKSNSSVLKENQNLSILCYLKIGLNSVKVFSNEENSAEFGTNDCSSQVIADLKKLNGDVNLSDCILTAESKKFYVQKAILAARSSTFFNMFKNNSSDGTIKVNDPTSSRCEIYDIPLSPEILTELLNFIYTGQLLNIEKSTDDLLKAANKYSLPSMKKLCAIHLGKKLSIDNAIDMLLLSVDCDTIDLKQQVIDFMIIHAKSIVNSRRFKTIGSLPDDIRENIMSILLQKLK